jgi:putative hydrolase of the HAD superfamily
VRSDLSTKYIYFDVGNTLLFPNRERIHAPLVERGVNPDAGLLLEIERKTKNQFDARMAKNGNTDQSFWWMFYSELLSAVGINDDPLRDQLVASIRQSANWDLILARTREHLEEIGGRYSISVISNADGKIEHVLRRCNIADCFRTITDSGLVGYEKPHPEIFRQALESMHAAPDQSLYVGDMYSVDYLGAIGVGMKAILMDVHGAYREKDVPRVESLQELNALLS